MSRKHVRIEPWVYNGNQNELAFTTPSSSSFDLCKYGLVYRVRTEPELGWKTPGVEVEIRLICRKPPEYDLLFESIANNDDFALEPGFTDKDAIEILLDQMSEHVEYLRDFADRLDRARTSLATTLETLDP